MYDCFIGLEIHLHLLTKTKMFCPCPLGFGQEPNTNICPICMGYPGVLPSVNIQAIKLGYILARALNCRLSLDSRFERKNYFYPDLPKNYQISQFHDPIGVNGWIELPFASAGARKIAIQDVHIEEDAGKMVHAGDTTLCDYNRAGYPLLEVVTYPELKNGEEAEDFLKYFQRFVRYLNISAANMEEGSLRCDANISVNLFGVGLGTKVEIKNLNSSRFVRKALNFEYKRQSAQKTQGLSIIQETRLWNENRDITESMRTKESSHDYRYFPDPDLRPFVPSKEFLEEVQASQGESPWECKNRFIAIGLSQDQADFVSSNRSLKNFFEKTVQICAHPATVANWLMTDVQKELNHFELALEDSPLSVERLAQLIQLLVAGSIHIKMAKKLLVAIFEEKKDPQVILQEKGWQTVTSEEELALIVDAVWQKHPAVVQAVCAGDLRQKGFLIGEVMRATDGRAHPGLVNQLLAKKLS